VPMMASTGVGDVGWVVPSMETRVHRHFGSSMANNAEAEGERWFGRLSGPPRVIEKGLTRGG
jgi:hypothetical protein